MDQRTLGRRLLLAIVVAALPIAARAQTGSSGPPAVGVVRAERQQITQTDEFIGRIQAVGRVALVARVTAFLEKRLFVEGAEVKKGDLLYQLEQPPFQAQVDFNKANVAQLEAQHRNAAADARAGAIPVEDAGRPAVERRFRARPGALAWRRRSRAPRRSCKPPRSISAIPRSARRSTARSAPPRSPKAMSSRRRAGPWRTSSARTRCM